jgi:hypothetical protein
VVQENTEEDLMVVTKGILFQAFAAILACSAIGSAQVGSVTVNQPITPVADATHVLVTAPYCPTAGQPFGVYNITTGTPVLFSDLSGLVPNQCQEISIAISPGLGGFAPGWVYVVYPNTSGTVSVAKIPPTGGAPQPFTTLTTPIPNPLLAVLGITFDQVGTFGNNLIVTTGTGMVATINAFGIASYHQITGGTCCGVELESPHVAPFGFGPYGGYLFMTGESPSAVFAVTPGTFVAVPLPAGPALAPRPESPAFNGPLVCSISVGPTGHQVQATLFDAVYGASRIELFNIPTPNTGFVNSEYQAAYNGQFTLNFLNPDGTLGAQIANVGAQQEHMNTITARTDTPSCPIPAQTCTLTQGGYKNHFNNLVLNFPAGGLLLGNHLYTNVQLNLILQDNAIRGNGLLSLAHQLITAELNLAYGAVPSTSAQLKTLTDAIAAANALIGNLLIPGAYPANQAGYLSPSLTSDIESILDTYNNGGLGAPHCND